ncbi:hypothetical protein KIPB_008434 [Kipferlia bialata]|uniref:Rad60/SUMO-like domain-containing protein n=1 Tax=Kipferlia bialata TaxID=797122 RepID=A0A9K3CZY7_9EUKA|nr:hypothetical protein KIPB_008434 [Kipferlia bialata]|eukprot:g8434.t1
MNSTVRIIVCSSQQAVEYRILRSRPLYALTSHFSRMYGSATRTLQFFTADGDAVSPSETADSLGLSGYDRLIVENMPRPSPESASAALRQNAERARQSMPQEE